NQGNRPSFSQALVYNEAENLYNDFKTKLSDRTKVKTGVFGAEMQVTLTNDGPVTIIIDSPPIA
ncbi:MAG TPA: D-aminoacyl-tRNA deacylase, partial [Bacilli bacterium]|nr:D-aminoacyl-tRNA deacylase [Bacilli bacterium]